MWTSEPMPRMRHGRPKYPSKIRLTQLQSHLPNYNPTYLSTVPLTHLQSHLRSYSPTYPPTIPLPYLQSDLPIYSPTYPTTVPLTYLQSHLPIYHPTYPSIIPLTQLQSHLPIYNPTYPSTIPLTHLQSHLPNCNRTCSWRGCSGPRLTLRWSTHRRHALPPRCRRAPRGGSSGAPPGSHLAHAVPLVAPPPHAGGLSPRCGAGPAAPGRCGGSSVGRWQIPLL